jgi:predicted O-linked N-acetylglucosamine transferase (SPINDLY family)
LLNLGLGEWVASNESEYIDIAAGLALDWNRLTALRSGLRECMRGSPVMDEPGFTRALEAIFRQALTAKAGSSNLEFVNPPTLT